MRERSPAARFPSAPAPCNASTRHFVAPTPHAFLRRRAGLRAPAALLALAALVSLGCMGRVLPRSVQAGSTVAIPLEGMNAVAPVGFGGTDIEDPQRGELVYSLDAESGPFELTTRGSAAVGAHAGAEIAWGSTRLYQVVSLVDVPSDAPLGTHPVDVVWRHPDPATGEILETPIDYEGELSILPASIEVTGPAGTETISGEPTPFQSWKCGFTGGCDWEPVSESKLRQAVPDPSVRIQLDTAVWAVELALAYPAGVIDVRDAYETPLLNVERRATTWLDDDGTGALSVSAAATRASFNSLSVAFALDDPEAAILDPADVSVSVVRAWDRDGNEIPASAAIGGVF